MTIRGKAFIAGVFEHPGRELPDRTLPQIHAEVAAGALADAGLSLADVDAYYSAGDAPGFGALSMVEYLGLDCTYVDDTETGGSAYLVHVQHAAAAIAAGHVNVALITLAGKPRTGGAGPGGSARFSSAPEASFENQFGMSVPGGYALAAARHMHEFGTTSKQLAEVKVAASTHAQHNPNAFLRDVVTVDEVVSSPMISDPLHRLDCCVITDGGGALVLVSEAVAASLDRHCVPVLGTGTSIKHTSGGRIDLTHTGASRSGPLAFAEAGITPADIDYVSIYDSFTITVLITLEDLGFCGKGGRRAIRVRRRSAVTGRCAAVQYRWWWAVQQPSSQPRRHDQGGRSRATAAWRGTPCGAGARLRACFGARHRRQPRHTHGKRHARHGPFDMSQFEVRSSL